MFIVRYAARKPMRAQPSTSEDPETFIGFWPTGWTAANESAHRFWQTAAEDYGAEYSTIAKLTACSIPTASVPRQ